MKTARFLRQYIAGEDIFRQHDAGDEAYFVEQGRVAIWSEVDGQRAVLAELGPGEVFGEMALISQHGRVAGATAQEPTRLRAITRGDLEQRLEAVDPLLRHVLETVMARLRSMMAGDTASEAGDGGQSPVFAAQALQALQREHAIAEALEANAFELHYQPIVRLPDGKVVGREALARWHHDGRWIPPPEFIPVTERSRLAVHFGRWVAETACAALAGALPDGYVSINVSTRQFEDGDVLARIAEQLAAAGIAPARLRLEVTETQLLEDWQQAIHWLDAARDIGMGIMLDDFGTGYSSLAYLHRLPLTALKIDRSFVASMQHDTASRKVLRTIVLLARDLGVDCVAEGIEEASQAEMLGGLGVAYGQGYYFGRPAPPVQPLANPSR